MGMARVVVAAFATARVVETVKEIIPVVPEPWAKGVFAGLVGAGVSLLSPEDRDARTVAVHGLAAAGIAAVVHDLQAALVSIADNNVTEVLQRLPRRAGPLPGTRPSGPLGA